MSEYHEGFAVIPNWIARDGSVSPLCKVVYLVLSSHTGKAGAWWISHRQIAEEAGMSVSSAIRSLRELRELGLVSWTERRSEKGDRLENVYSVALTRPGDPGPEPPSDTTPSQGDRGVWSDSHKGPVPVTEQQEEPKEEPKEERTLSEGVDDDTTPDAKASSSSQDSFDAWWATYPRKVGKEVARRAYAAALRRKGVTAADLLAGLERALPEMQATISRPNGGVRFIPHASTWLNGGRWLDESPSGVRPADEAGVLALLRGGR